MGSIGDQQFLIARETVPGVPETTGFRSYHGLRATMGYESDGESFKAAGFRVNTARNTTEEYGAHDVETVQCYNAALPVLSSVLGAPVSTPLVGAPTKGATHVFTLKARGKRSPVVFTGVYGDEDEAFLLANLVFNELKYGVSRSELSLETSAISRTPVAGHPLPVVGVEEIIAVPINSRDYDIFLDDTAENWGTTQYLEAYEASLEIGELWGRNTPINSAFKSFRNLVENEDVDYQGEIKVGMDASMRGLISTYEIGAVKYVRVSAEGPIIDGTDRYSIQIDYPVRVTAPKKTESAPNSPTLVLPFDYELTSDPDSGNAIIVTLVNDVLTL